MAVLAAMRDASLLRETHGIKIGRVILREVNREKKKVHCKFMSTHPYGLGGEYLCF